MYQRSRSAAASLIPSVHCGTAFTTFSVRQTTSAKAWFCE